MRTIYAVDDSNVNLAEVELALEKTYNILTMSSAADMFRLLEKVKPDLILLDIEMPEMGGFEALERLKKDNKTANIPVMFLTSSRNEAIEARGFELGVVDFFTKPFSSPILLNRIANHIQISDLIKKRTKHIKNLQNIIVSIWADTVENRDKHAMGHIERTASYVKILIESMKENNVYADEMYDWNSDTVASSSHLHDIGKITIPDTILNKPGKLTDEEFEIVKEHALEGGSIISRIMVQTDGDDFLRHAKLFANCHHERWDGTGYPRRLKGTEIPLQGRIMAVADVYDALLSERPYKKTLKHEEAVDIIMEGSGKHFDPQIADVFFKVKDEFSAANAIPCMM